MFNKKAFTLIEVLISLALFTTLSIFLTRAINQTTRAQKQVDGLVKNKRILRNVSYLIQKDIKNSLRTTNSLHWAYQSYKGCILNRGDESFFQAPYMGIEDQNFLHASLPFPFMQMQGLSDQIFLAQISPQGVLQKIEYILEDCLDKDDKTVSCLVRNTYDIENDISLSPEDTKETIPLIRNITELNFSYYDSNDKDWRDDFEQKNKNSFSSNTLERSEYFPLPLPLALRIETIIDESPLNIHVPIEQAFLSEKIKKMNTYKPRDVTSCSNQQPPSTSSKPSPKPPSLPNLR